MNSKIIKLLLRIILLFSIFLLVLIYIVKRPTFSSNSENQSTHNINPSDLKSTVKILSESFLPRNSDNPQNLLATAKYIKSKLEKYNSDTNFQTYTVYGDDYSNVISNFGPDTQEIIVIGAHYDAYSTHPGADDNASGVAGLLEIGRLLSEQELSKRIVLVAYTLEEPPYFASENMGSYIHANSIKDKDVLLMVSLEMIGYFNDEEGSQNYPVSSLKYLYTDKGNFITVVGEIFSNETKALKESIIEHTGLETYSINAPSFLQGIDFSDHRNYWALDYPAVMVTDTAFFRNHMYHTPNDTYDRLDYERMSKVIYGVFKHIIAL